MCKKLKINPKWKYIVKDRDCSRYILFEEMPRLDSFGNWYAGNRNEYITYDSLLSLDLGDSQNSLHKIEEDGTLISVAPLPDLKENDPILVRDSENNEWVKRHFKCWSHDGRAVYFYSGCCLDQCIRSSTAKYFKLP